MVDDRSTTRGQPRNGCTTAVVLAENTNGRVEALANTPYDTCADYLLRRRAATRRRFSFLGVERETPAETAKTILGETRRQSWRRNDQSYRATASTTSAPASTLAIIAITSSRRYRFDRIPNSISRSP